MTRKVDLIDDDGGMRSDEPNKAVDNETLLARSLVRAAKALGLHDLEVARILGQSPAAYRGLQSQGSIDENSPHFKQALLLIRVYQSLYARFSGDETVIQEWIRTENTELGGVPAELMESRQGLLKTCEYLEESSAQL